MINLQEIGFTRKTFFTSYVIDGQVFFRKFSFLYRIRPFVSTGDKNRDVTDNIFRAPCMFCEESLGKMNGKVVELLRNGFEALITLGQVTTSGVEKAKKCL